MNTAIGIKLECEEYITFETILERYKNLKESWLYRKHFFLKIKEKCIAVSTW